MSDHRYVRQALNDEGPLCPLEGEHPAHLAVVAVRDAYEQAFPRDAEGECLPEHDPILVKAYSARVLRGMHLYQVSTSTDPLTTTPTVVVSAWYFKCPICRFILPATSAGPVR